MSVRRISMPYQIGTLLVAGVMIIFTGGYYAYSNLTKMVRLLQLESAPHYGLVTIKDITASAEQAENNVRLYGITKQEIYLENYSEVIINLDSSIRVLHTQYPDDMWFNSRIDTIEILAGQMVQLWDELIVILNIGGRADIIANLEQELETPATESAEEKGIFARIFNSDKKDKSRRLENVIDKLNQLKSDEKEIEKKLIEKEKELASSGEMLSNALMSLMYQLENRQKKEEIKHYENAEEIASRTYLLMGVFFLSGSLLSIVVLILIIQYIRKSRKYNEILVRSRMETENLAKSKELFMAKVSHEIRTPLNAITGFIKQLLASSLDSSVREKLKIVDSAGDHLIHLTNDVLDFTKLQEGKLVLHKSHFDPEKTIRNICDLFQESARNNGNKIHFRVENEGKITLFGDAHRFQQIVYNLLSNAVKFTENGRIDINAGISSLSGNFVQMELSVEDTGAGIHSSKLDEIFRDYAQEDQNIAVRYGGTGLGLSIVKRLVEMFSGEIAIDSRKGSGTRVSCKLRFEVGSNLETEPGPDKKRRFYIQQDVKLLIADDELYNRLLVQNILDNWGARYDIARNGLEAIELAKDNSYDYILMDLRMPVIDGITATRFIRETLKRPKDRVPVIGITADTSNNLPPKSRELFTAILVKPFTEEELYNVLHHKKSKREVDSGPDNALPSSEGKRVGDLSSLVRIAGKDMQFVRDMIRQFEISTIEGLKEMKSAAGGEDFALVADLAHKLAPASRHLRVFELLNVLKQIEEKATGGMDSKRFLQLYSKAEQFALSAIADLKRQLQELET